MQRGPRYAPESTTRSRLVAAAVRAFTSIGYDGVSVREIERQAEVNRGLVAYHFGTKDALWREAVNWLMARFHEEFTPYQETLREVRPTERELILLTVHARFCSKYPEYLRLLLLEGDQDSDRKTWLVEQHLRPGFEFFARVAHRQDFDAPEAAAVAHFAFLGASSMISAVPALCRSLFGVDPTHAQVADLSAQVAARFGMELPLLADDLWSRLRVSIDTEATRSGRTRGGMGLGISIADGRQTEFPHRTSPLEPGAGGFDVAP